MAVAEKPRIDLQFAGGCPDCGRREVMLPGVLPGVGDDFDWDVRDYDGFRLFMMQELAARFPERSRWTPADVEVVLVEVLASVLDQLSDTLDRVSAEAFLETARQPASVRRLLEMIGYDAVQLSGFEDDVADTQARSATQKLDDYWLNNPAEMDAARRAGPRDIRTQRRMVTLDDYVNRLEEHPLVMRATAWLEWGGSWDVIRVAVIVWNQIPLDGSLAGVTGAKKLEKLQEQVDAFHHKHSLPGVGWDSDPAIRTVLRRYIDAWRMTGQEVLLQDAEPVGINMALSISINGDYFQSEIRNAVEQALGKGSGGYFETGRLQFGEDLHAGDIFQTLMALAGVESVCLNRFKRVGSQYQNMSDSGLIELSGLEIAVCDNVPDSPERGFYTLYLHGGRKG